MKVTKELDYTLEEVGLNYENLCINLNLDLTEGFKMPKFVPFNGTRNSLALLKVYCNQFVGVGKMKHY